MDILLFLPETLVSAIAVFLLCLTLAKKETAEHLLRPCMTVAALLLVAGCVLSLDAAGNLFHGTYRVDLLSQGFKLTLALAFLFITLFSEYSVSIDKSREVEHNLFLSTSLLGMMMITSAVDLLTLYVSLELSAYSLYLLTAMRIDKRSAEAGIKYLLFGAATSGIFLWGAGLLAGVAGTTSLTAIAGNFDTLIAYPAFLLGLVFTLFSFLFKLSAFPLHFWAPDVYESAPTPITTFIATASKAAAVAIFIRFFLWLTPEDTLVGVLAALAFLSMTLGNCVALVQQDVKRLLAYSSIAQAGYILVGLLAGSFEGFSSVFFYALAYLLMNAGAFFVTLVVAKESRHDNPQVSHFDGLAERSPFLALLLLVSLLSLAGIPPLVGFTGKWVLFSAAMDKGHWFLVLWGVLNSVVSLFYYLTLVKHSYLEKPKDKTLIAIPLTLKVVGFTLFFAIVLLGIYPAPLLTWTQEAVTSAILP